MQGIHSVSPPPAVSGHVGEDPSSKKKLRDGEGLWEVKKEILGWMMDGASRCLEIAEKKRLALLMELKRILRMKRGVPFKQFQKVVVKL